MYLPKDAIFQMECRISKLELDMQALFNADLHLDRWILFRKFSTIEHNKFFFFSDSVVVPVDDNVDEVSKEK